MALFVLSAGNLLAAPAQAARIVLPVRLIAGQPATLAVLSSDGHIAPGSKIALSDGQVLTTDESGRAHFLVPPQAVPLFARIIGSEIRAVADVLQGPSSGRDLQSIQAPAIAPLGDALVITGSGFEGDADRNIVEINGRRTLVLASSPAELILMPPAKTAPGAARLSIGTGAGAMAASLTFVSVTPMDSRVMQIRRGKQTTIALLVRGTVQPLNMEIRALTPHVAEFHHGDALLVRSTGGAANSAVIRIKGLASGQFSYSVSVQSAPTPSGWQNACDFLRTAAKIAPPDAGKKLESILKKLQRKPADVNKLRRELQSIAISSTASDFQTLIDAARRSLYGN